ncbi:unnamed protein product [Toxocara canis]|uniref:Uncharacterized protein n=1 Tax=Toxocara canis TaxID=6265 RepID=A0A3P7HAF1_TOXCA|nr:unnamed protein product [Toxocara canis]
MYTQQSLRCRSGPTMLCDCHTATTRDRWGTARHEYGCWAWRERMNG